MTDLLHEHVYTKTLTLTVVPFLYTIPEVQEEALVDQVIESPSTTITNIPTTKSKQKRANKLLKKAIRQKNDSTKTIIQKLADHEKRLNALTQVDYTEVIKESVKENMLNE
ncbi:hypothetical protein Tco_0240259, partial [Tanacetum coccineum]